MARVETGYPDEMVFRSGGGCAMIIGIPMLLIGLGILSLPLWAKEEASFASGVSEDSSR